MAMIDLLEDYPEVYKKISMKFTKSKVDKQANA